MRATTRSVSFLALHRLISNYYRYSLNGRNPIGRVRRCDGQIDNVRYKSVHEKVFHVSWKTQNIIIGTTGRKFFKFT
jgi:hypothetical protein